MTTVCLENLAEHNNRFQTTIKEKVYNARQTGKVKTWKTKPGQFLVAVMYGLYEPFYIANFSGTYHGKTVENNAEKWELVK